MRLIDTMSLKEGRKVWIVASVTVAAPYEAFVVYEIWETEKVNVERSVVYVVACATSTRVILFCRCVLCVYFCDR
jgi:hypothetical protein